MKPREREDVLTPDEAAAYLRVSRRELQRLPVVRLKLGHRTIRYRRADLDAYLQRTEDAA